MDFSIFKHNIAMRCPELAFGCHQLRVLAAVQAIAVRAAFPRVILGSENPNRSLEELWNHIENFYLPKRKA